MNSTNGLGGHIELIRRYAKQHYANDYFDVIPVMLLAAQMSREAEHQEHKDELFKASRIQDFLDAIRVSLVDYGVIRRSQTLLGSTVGAIEEPNKWVTKELEAYQNLTNHLKNMHNKFREGIMNQQQIFKAAEIATKFKNICIKFDKILAQANHPEFVAIRHKLRDEVKEYSKNGILTVAFVGQYNAGKSTAISALTGQRDIKIDSDIATDVTATYDWNSIKVIDTPGLFTDRQDHDEITYEAINKADLLVFNLTYMLFDLITIENFKKLAYEKVYRWKMMLLINKMSDEAGEEAQKIANYRKSLADVLNSESTDALKPLKSYSLDEFPVCFIDAKDYCDGIDQDDDFLIEISRFQTFIDALNNFVERRAALARFDTPVRIVLASVDEAQLSFTRNSDQDATFLEVLTRLSRTVCKERERLRTKFQSIGLEMSSAIAKEGIKLANSVGTTTKEDFETLNNQIALNVQNYYETAIKELKIVVEKAVEEITQEV